MMEKVKILVSLLILFISQIEFAQTSNSTAKTTPLVDPKTNCAIRYYYFPNIEAYFDTQKSIYYFKEDGEWVTADEIPEGYRGYSVNNRLNVIVTDYDDDIPYQFINIHKKKYPYTSSGRIRTVSTD